MAVASIDLCIVGAGAAGLAAGIFAAEQNPHLRIELLDGAKTIGAKILVSCSRHDPVVCFPRCRSEV